MTFDPVSVARLAQMDQLRTASDHMAETMRILVETFEDKGFSREEAFAFAMVMFEGFIELGMEEA